MKTKTTLPVVHTTMATEIGQITVAATIEDAVVAVFFADAQPHLMAQAGDRDDGGCVAVVDQLSQYFAGERTSFDLQLAAEGTAFQHRVWQALWEIPYGELATYSQIAAAFGQPTASRAAGSAIGKNPISIIVPCHRVVGAQGALTGYAGGLARKKWLLQHEGAMM